MEKEKLKILVADDETEIRDVLSMLLTAEGFEDNTAADGKEALDLADESVDLYILDVNMPLMSGFAAGSEIRKRFYTPIMFLTAYSAESDKLMGFSAGADDYLVKPFSNTELLIRVKALLRRARDYSHAWQTTAAEAAVPKNEIHYKDLILDLDTQSIRKGDEVIVLTYTEYKMLELFLSHPKKIYSLDNIYQSIWEEDAVGDSTIMVHIKNLRRKLNDNSRNPQYIKTAWGKGYYVD